MSLLAQTTGVAALIAAPTNLALELTMNDRQTLGLGYHILDVDISVPLIETGGSIVAVDAIVQGPDGQQDVISAPATAILSAPLGDGSAHLYTRDVITASCETQAHTFMQFSYDFSQRGEHRVAMRFVLNAVGYSVTSTRSFSLHIADGLFGD